MSLGRWLVVAALALAPTAAFAQGSQQPQIVPAAAYHPGTKVTFPAQIADASQTKTVDYGKTYNEPGLGQSWHYTVPQTLSASVYLYTYGQTSISAGPNSPALLGQFQQATGDISESKKYAKIAVLRGPSDCTAGTLTFRCVTISAVVTSTGAQDKLQLLMTGFRNHFLKIRLDWHQGSPAGDAAADRFVQTLATSVLR